MRASRRRSPAMIPPFSRELSARQRRMRHATYRHAVRLLVIVDIIDYAGELAAFRYSFACLNAGSCSMLPKPRATAQAPMPRHMLPKYAR